jgi:TrpR-related protein YerC/YecD
MLHNKQVHTLYQAILQLDSEDECCRFLEDICTIKELQEISQRLAVAMALSDGKNYAAVSAETGASTATISRVNRCLLYGSGGYQTVIQRLKEEGDSDGDQQ